MPDKPRNFKETVAAQDPADQARLANAESFDDVTVSSPFHRQVTVIEDSDSNGDWRVEYFDDDGACYITSFAGPKAEQRASCFWCQSPTRRLMMKAKKTRKKTDYDPPADPGVASMSRAIENCPPRRHEELPPPWLAEERANERGANHGNPFVEKSTGAGDEDAGRRGGDVAAEGARVGAEADRAAAWMQPSRS